MELLRQPLLWVLTTHLGLALCCLPYYRYQTNPDGISYLSIAHKWAAGHFYQAINAYWSPLYSWLAVPLLAAGITPLLAAKILAIVVGTVGLVVLWWLGTNAGLRRDIRIWMSLGAIVPLVYFEMSINSPDLLAAVAMLAYLAYLLDPRHTQHRFGGAMTGLLAGVCYLAKAYALPFIAGHFLLITVAELIAGRHRRQVLLRALQMLCMLGLVVLAWSGLLKLKYGLWMTGSAGEWNHRLDGPAQPPQRSGRLLPPPDHYSISAWDDPTYIPLPAWSPFESQANWAWQKSLIKNNLLQICGIVQWFTLLGCLIAGLALLLSFSPIDPRLRHTFWVLTAALWLYPCGYYLLHVEPRFLILVGLLLLVLGAMLVNQATATKNSLPCALAMIVLVLSVGWNPAQWLLHNKGTGQSLQQTWDALRGLIPPGSDVASISWWDAGLYLAADQGLRYWGEPVDWNQEAGTESLSTEAELKEYNIRYLLLWIGPESYPFLNGWVEISGGKVPGVRLYQAPEPTPRDQGM